MPRTFICTTGTSIANGCPSLREIWKRKLPWDDASELLAKLDGEIESRLAGFTLETISTSSAELAVLSAGSPKEKCGPDDEVILLVTDTGDGRVCAERAGKCMEDTLKCKTKIERIEGLQVRDKDVFKKKGIVNFVATVEKYARDPQRAFGGGIVMCPVGGYKAGTLYLALCGMLFNAESRYIFEGSSALLKLPPLPVTTDADLFKTLLPAIVELEEREGGTTNAGAFWKKIPEELHERASGFFEEYDDFLALSPLSRPLYKEHAARRPKAMLQVSEKVVKILNDSSRVELRQYMDAIMGKLCDTNWREQHKELYNAKPKLQGVVGFKINGDNMVRFLGFERGGVFHLGLMFLGHDAYEQELKSLTLRDLEKFEFREWAEVEKEFHPKLPVAIPAKEEQEKLEKLREENRDLRQDAELAKTNLARAKAEIEQLRQELNTRKQEIGKLQSKLARKPPAPAPSPEWHFPSHQTLEEMISEIEAKQSESEKNSPNAGGRPASA